MRLIGPEGRTVSFLELKMEDRFRYVDLMVADPAYDDFLRRPGVPLTRMDVYVTALPLNFVFLVRLVMIGYRTRRFTTYVLRRYGATRIDWSTFPTLEEWASGTGGFDL